MQGLIPKALPSKVRAEIREILKRDEDHLTIEQVAQRLAVSKDWVYRNGRKLNCARKLGRKIVSFFEAGLEKWLKDRER